MTAKEARMTRRDILRVVTGGEDPPVIPPPATINVLVARTPMLYASDGTPLVRKIGY